MTDKDLNGKGPNMFSSGTFFSLCTLLDCMTLRKYNTPYIRILKDIQSNDSRLALLGSAIVDPPNTEQLGSAIVDRWKPNRLGNSVIVGNPRSVERVWLEITEIR